jgi:excisionase family DNA binding protein
MTSLLTVAEVAERLRCSQSMVYEHVAQGRLAAYRVGAKKGYRFSEEQIEAFLEASAIGKEPEPPFKHVR